SGARSGRRASLNTLVRTNTIHTSPSVAALVPPHARRDPTIFCGAVTFSFVGGFYFGESTPSGVACLVSSLPVASATRAAGRWVLGAIRRWRRAAAARCGSRLQRPLPMRLAATRPNRLKGEAIWEAQL